MAKNTIKIKKYLDIMEERVAVGVITPGMLIELTSANKFQAHSTASGNVAPPMFAVEDELQGKEIGDAYAVGDVVQGWVTVRGEQVYALLADGENVAIGDKLASNGDGYLKKHDDDSARGEEIVAIALEAVNLTGASSADEAAGGGRIEVMVI